MNPWTAACQAALSSTIFQSLLRFMPFELVMLTISSSAALFYFCCQSFPALVSFPMIGLLTSGDQSLKSFNSNISPSNDYSGLIFFRIVWSDFLEVQWILKSLLQHHTNMMLAIGFLQFFLIRLKKFPSLPSLVTVLS